MKEEIDYDPSKTERLLVNLNLNDKKGNGHYGLDWMILGSVPWIIDEVDERIQTALGIDQLYCLYVDGFYCKSWVANEFLDVLTCYDHSEFGLDKLIFEEFWIICEPFEDEVFFRLANICQRLSHLGLRSM